MDVLPSRVNIRLDIESLGAGKRFELPLKLLMIGDFSADESAISVEERERITVTKDNIDSVLARFKPRLKMALRNYLDGDDEELEVCLGFEEFMDFSPESLVSEIPELRRLVAMRNLLKDLKSNLLDDKALRKGLRELFEHPDARQKLKDEIEMLMREDQGGDDESAKAH